MSVIYLKERANNFRFNSPQRQSEMRFRRVSLRWEPHLLAAAGQHGGRAVERPVRVVGVVPGHRVSLGNMVIIISIIISVITCISTSRPDTFMMRLAESSLGDPGPA